MYYEIWGCYRVSPTSDVPATTGVPATSGVSPTCDVPPTSIVTSTGVVPSPPPQRYPTPSDMANSLSSRSDLDIIHHQQSMGIFTSSSYDDDFLPTAINLAPVVDVPSTTTTRIHQVEPSSVALALDDPSWVESMQEEMQQFLNQNVWKLVLLPVGKRAIGTSEMLGASWLEINLSWLLKAIIERRVSITMRCLHLWLVLRPFACFWPLHHTWALWCSKWT